ncbi:IS110 family transposase [Limibacterium fermenti]|uniref:IS110 family transposase n=1 Tax=Limibacterium fermenti TaxID=3229863 RepID=UPI003A752B52
MRTVCGLDIHKDSIFMCILDEQGKKSERKFGVSTREIKGLCNTLKSHYVSEVCMESTGIYWKPVWHLLEKDFRMYLVNPQFLKQLPGRKSDVKDAQWIATALLKGLVRNSFVPDSMIQQLRLYGRRINELNKDIIRCEQRVDMILQSCNIRISNYVSNIDGKSYQKVVGALLEGERSADKLVKLIHGRTLNKHGRDTVRDSLEGYVQQADIDLLKQYMEALKMHQAQKQTCLIEMVKLCKKHYDRAFTLLQSIPAIKEQSAAIIISEIGTDMTLFATAAALVSWAGLRPRNDESAGKIKSRKITHGNKYLRKALMEAAWGASRTRGSIFYNKFWRLRQRGKKQQKCTVAIARHLLVIIWSLLSRDEYFDKEYMQKLSTGVA